MDTGPPSTIRVAYRNRSNTSQNIRNWGGIVNQLGDIGGIINN